jgi:hypothetical protein
MSHRKFHIKQYTCSCSERAVPLRTTNFISMSYARLADVRRRKPPSELQVIPLFARLHAYKLVIDGMYKGMYHDPAVLEVPA